MSARPLRIVAYAVNGSGVGHLVRQVAIHRWVRRYAAHAGWRPEIYFLTTSEAEGMLLAERFASFKMPSKTVVEDASIDKTTYLALAKQWVWHSLGLLRPDLLVVDTFPRGSFGELLSALDLCRKKALVLRPVKESFATRVDFQAMLPLYDLVVVPETESTGAMELSDAVRARTRFVGPVLSRERAELLDREVARARLGIAPDRLVVFVSAGGGGDTGARAHVEGALAALRDDSRVHVVVGAGPLYRGPAMHGPNVTWIQTMDAFELARAFDVAVCGAGYNTVQELSFAGVPAVLVPQEKVADAQDVRAARSRDVGAAFVLDGPDRLRDLRAHIEPWLADASARALAASRARTLVPDNHARVAAAELLRLVMPGHLVDAAAEAVDDALLTLARDASASLDDILAVLDAIDPASADSGRIGPAAAGAHAALEVIRHAAALDAPLPAITRIAHAFSRKLPGSSPVERATASRTLLTALAPFRDWAGANAFCRLLQSERQLGALELADQLAAFLGALRSRDEDLFRGMALLAKAQGNATELATNARLLRAASTGDA